MNIAYCIHLIEAAHGGRGRGDHIVDEEEEGILWPQTDSLANEEVELKRNYTFLSFFT